MERREGPPAEERETEERSQRRPEWSGWLRSLVLPLLLLAAIVGGLWWYQSREESGSTQADGRFGVVELPAGRNPTGRPPAAEVGRAAPDFLLEQLDGPSVRLSDLQGNPVLVNFWATWCRPCRQEIPELAAAYDRHREEGLVILGVNLQEADDTVRPFAREFGMTFPILMDRTGQVSRAWRVGGPGGGIPASYFVDRQGVIRDLYQGPMTAEVVEDKLASILEESG